MTDPLKPKKLSRVNGAKVPLAIVVSAFVALVSIGIAIRANDLRQVNERASDELAKVTIALRENTAAIRSLALQVERGQARLDAHVELEGHPGMQSRVRELELKR